MIWVGILVGVDAGLGRGVKGLMFTVMFPITFVANTFVPTENMPAWPTIAEWNPILPLVQACATCGATARRLRPAWPSRCTTR